MENPIKRAMRSLAVKGLSLVFDDGRQLPGRGYTGDNRFFTENLSYGKSDAGVAVTSDVALNYTAFWSCVRLITRTMASLPCITFERQEPRGKIRATEHPNYRLLHDEPNPEMDAYSYIECLIYHLIASNGNAYSYKEFKDDRLTIKYLWPMDPGKVTKGRDPVTNEVVYLYRLANEQITLPAYRVWHIPGFGYDGLVGYTPLTYARNLIGLGVAAEKMGSKLFANGLTFGGFLQHPKVLGNDAKKHFEEQLKAAHKGVDKAHQIMILEEGMTYSKNSIPPNDAQMLETRKFQRNEMAAFFGVPPHKIGDLEKATFSNIEQQNLEYSIDCIRPLAVRIEKSANRQLYLPQEKGKYFNEFLMDALLRGDQQARATFYRELYYLGALSPNDIREKENMNPIEDPAGDEYFTQQNMIALSMLARQGPGRDPEPTDNQ